MMDAEVVTTYSEEKNIYFCTFILKSNKIIFNYYEFELFLSRSLTSLLYDGQCIDDSLVIILEK